VYKRQAILRSPDLTATNDIQKSPEFFYANSIVMSFLDGYDESVLTVPSGDPNTFTCILPSSFMETQGISLGDTVRVAINRPYTDMQERKKLFRHFDLLVIGSYEKQGADDTIYTPLSLFFNTGLIWDAGQTTVGGPSETFDTGYSITSEQKNDLQDTVFNSTYFTLADSRALFAFKDELTNYGYSQVNKISTVREYIVLKDAAFNNAIASVKQQIRYIDTLYPFLYVLVGIIALVVSYLLVVSRKKEFATMRGLGATRFRTFFSFFYEQGILCLLGTAIGLVVWQFVWSRPTELHLMLIVGFLTCYFIGSAISITIMNQSKVLSILFDRD
jgi:ABC-type antimicrobial peptide transport system permease subunit